MGLDSCSLARGQAGERIALCIDYLGARVRVLPYEFAVEERGRKNAMIQNGCSCSSPSDQER